jgi:hypothetical protein
VIKILDISDQDRAAVDRDDRAGAVAVPHQVEKGLGDVADLARPTSRSAWASEAYMAERSSSLMSRQRLLRTTPGATAFTRIGASSTASARVSASTAPQMLEATVQVACGRALAMPELRTIEPPGRKRGAACLTAA